MNKTSNNRCSKLGKHFWVLTKFLPKKLQCCVLSMPLIMKSRTVIYVDSQPPEKRVTRLRFLGNLDDDDEDVYCTTIHDRYAARPTNLEEMCLAKFATTFAPSAGRPSGDDVASADSDPSVPQHDAIGSSRRQPRITLQNNMGTMVQCRRAMVLRTHKVNQEKDPVGYKYSRLVLFLPWRSETTLLQQAEELYATHYTTIEENASAFNSHEDQVDLASELLANRGHGDNLWDAVAPTTQHIEGEAAIEGATTLRPFEEDSNDITPVSSDTTPHSQSALGRLFTTEARKQGLTNQQYRSMFRHLNDEQKDFVMFNRQWCKDTVKRIKQQEPIEPYHVYLSGPGGTGKSHVIRMVQRDINHFFRQLLTDVEDEPLVLLTAFTGTAAFNINGITLHSALSLPTTSGNPHLSAEKLTTLQSRLQHLKLLVIDEISMISLNTLVIVHERLCAAKQVSVASAGFFAGTSVLVVGDFFQLPPVAGRVICKPATPHTVSDLAPSPWTIFKLHELTAIMRQSEDRQFGDMLNTVRTATPHLNSNIDLFLKSLIIQNTDPTYPSSWMHVFARNKHAMEHNHAMLQSLDGVEHLIHAKDSARDGHTRLANIRFPDDFQKTGRLMKVLTLKVNARVMLTTNIDITDGLTNGAMGKVVHLQYDTDQQTVKTILVEFDDERVGKSAIASSRFRRISRRAVSIQRIQATFPIGGRRTCEGQRIQFPLVLSWAVTIHKVQGLTLSNVVVDMDPKKGRFGFGQAYVAFSRVRNQQALRILNYDRQQIKADPSVHDFIHAMRTDSLLHVPIECAPRHPSAYSVIHQNVENITVHAEDINQHSMIQRSDIICFTETHLHADDPWPLVDIDSINYNIFRVERTNRNGGGIAICVKASCSSSNSFSIILPHLELLHVKIVEPFPLHVICVYRSPRGSVQLFMTELIEYITPLARESCIVLGDMNIDIDPSSQTSPFVMTMSNIGLRQYITHPTTDLGTCLDHLFVANCHILDTRVTDVYYSYHDCVSSIVLPSPL